eukprot:m.243562 g.243562  ORF g.243562 m.243562 type:complete len:106 (+) comp14263_c0_seq1:168-485(+)
MEMEGALADAKRRGRSIAVITGLCLLALGTVLIIASIGCYFDSLASCANFKGNLDRMAYVGVFCVVLFCCAPCFSLSEEDMRKFVPYYKLAAERRAAAFQSMRKQ